ncbi:hypothetical protein [Emticicia aquatilis]|nr:hypothetical protein [Emticicia aquatilis]
MKFKKQVFCGIFFYYTVTFDYAQATILRFSVGERIGLPPLSNPTEKKS